MLEYFSGNVADEYALNFETAVPLKLVSADPVNHAVSVPTNKVIKITFNKPIEKREFPIQLHSTQEQFKRENTNNKIN